MIHFLKTILHLHCLGFVNIKNREIPNWNICIIHINQWQKTLLICSAVGKSAQGFFFNHRMEHFPTIALLTLESLHYCSTQCIDQAQHKACIALLDARCMWQTQFTLRLKSLGWTASIRKTSSISGRLRETNSLSTNQDHRSGQWMGTVLSSSAGS